MAPHVPDPEDAPTQAVPWVQDGGDPGLPPAGPGLPGSGLPRPGRPGWAPSGAGTPPDPDDARSTPAGGADGTRGPAGRRPPEPPARRPRAKPDHPPAGTAPDGTTPTRPSPASTTPTGPSPAGTTPTRRTAGTGPPTPSAAAASSSARTQAPAPPQAAPAPEPRRGLRYRILPRTLLGTTALILSFAVGAGLSGVVLYSYYQYRLDQTNTRVNALVNGYQKQFDQAEKDVQNTANQAKSQIQSQLAPVEDLQGDPAAEAALVKKVSPSVFFVHTLDTSGAASVGTAFVVTSNATESLLLTSYTTVAAATHSPAPPVYVRQGNADTQVTVRTWDAADDLALIVLPKPGLPVLPAAPVKPAPTIGQKLYAISGLGSAGASISEGAVSDVTASGLADTAPIGPQFQGGPLINAQGQVVAVASRTFAPLGFATNNVWYAPYLQAACAKVLTCPGGNFPTSS